MNIDRIYEFRFNGVEPESKKKVWLEISNFIFRKLKYPNSILVPAAGFCEFVNAIPVKEKWAIDINSNFLNKYANKGIKKIVGNCIEVPIPSEYFEAIFVSNFLEHLNDANEINKFLGKMFDTLKKDGKIVIMGPNFKYAYREYYDFADHKIALTELSVTELLYAVGFINIQIYSKFLPLSFRGKMPLNKYLVRLYLKMPLFWRIFGKQFLIIAQK